MQQHKYLLTESQMPTQWYNIVPDLPAPPPPALHPGTLEPAGHLDLASYEQFLAGEIVDFDLSDDSIAAALADVPVVST